MTTQEKIEKLGYRLTVNETWRDGEGIVGSYTAHNPGHWRITAPDLIRLLQILERLTDKSQHYDKT